MTVLQATWQPRARCRFGRRPRAAPAALARRPRRLARDRYHRGGENVSPVSTCTPNRA